LTGDDVPLSKFFYSPVMARVSVKLIRQNSHKHRLIYAMDVGKYILDSLYFREQFYLASLPLPFYLIRHTRGSRPANMSYYNTCIYATPLATLIWTLKLHNDSTSIIFMYKFSLGNSNDIFYPTYHISYIRALSSLSAICHPHAVSRCSPLTALHLNMSTKMT